MGESHDHAERADIDARPANDIRSRGTRYLRRARSLPWSDQSIMLLGIVLALLLAPAWLDPMTLTELGPPRSPADPIDLTPGPRTAGPRSSEPPVVGGPEVVVMRDTFARTVESGWGLADLGGEYGTLEWNVDLGVADGAGRMILSSPTSSVSAFLPDISARDVRLTFAVSFDQMPVGGGIFVYGLVRGTQVGLSYRPKIQITPNGSVLAHVGLLLPTGEQSLGRQVLIPDVTAQPHERIWISIQAVGGDPTRIAIRAWEEGQPEPDYWHFSVIDWTGALQGRGMIGVASYLGIRTTSGPVELAFTDLTATTTDLQGE